MIIRFRKCRKRPYDNDVISQTTKKQTKREIIILTSCVFIQDVNLHCSSKFFDSHSYPPKNDSGTNVKMPVTKANAMAVLLVMNVIKIQEPLLCMHSRQPFFRWHQTSKKVWHNLHTHSYTPGASFALFVYYYK